MERSMYRLLPVLLSSTLALVSAGCDRPTAAQGQTTQARSKPVHVDTVTVAEREMPSSLMLAGTLKPNQESELAANANGRVLRTMVERGSYVSQGAAIAQLDTRTATLSAAEAQANLETARTQRAQAESDCGRFQRLMDKGAISQAEFDRQTSACKTAITSAQAAESRALLANQTLGDATIRAPFSGLVAERYISVGEYVRADGRVAHLIDIDPLRLELTIPEQNLGAVKQGQKVQFQVAAFPNQTFTGTVHYIGPSVRASTRDLVFEAIVTNKDKLLRPGLFATARLDAGTQKLPVVPKSALKQDGETFRAFAVVEKHVEERVVQTGASIGDEIAIVKGLSAGEKIVAQPTDAISDGLDIE
jgi:RND family efflux transporter MFP subunit